MPLADISLQDQQKRGGPRPAFELSRRPDVAGFDLEAVSA